jgi:hypothetical protein
MIETEQWRIDMVNRASSIGMAFLGMAEYRQHMTEDESARYSRLGLALTAILDEMVRIVDPTVFDEEEE